MATFSTIADEVVRKLAGFTLRQDRQTYLTSAVSTTDLTISVKSAQNVSNGIIQIDTELMYVESYDRVSNTLTIPPYGRGYNGTTVQSHQNGAKVVVSPTFPIVDVKQAINDTIQDAGTELFVVGTTSFAFSPAVSTYALPNEAEFIISVTYKSTGPTKEWVPVRGYRFDRMANVATFNSTKTITLLAPVEPGRTVQVTYGTEPSVLENDTDDFSIVSGLPESCRDLIVLGASYRLVSFVDPGRLTYGSAESDQHGQVAGRAYGAGTNASKYLLLQYEQRLAKEINRLQNLYPIRVTYTR